MKAGATLVVFAGEISARGEKQGHALSDATGNSNMESTHALTRQDVHISLCVEHQLNDFNVLANYSALQRIVFRMMVDIRFGIQKHPH
jgi:hypothetical protein